MNSQLLDYITRCRMAEMTDDQIRQDLLKAGWQPADIDEGFRGAGTIPPAAPVVESQKPKASSPVKIIATIVLALLLIGGAAFGFYMLDKQFGWGIFGR